ncbi:MAG: 30S ribosomal protein S17 [Candidatus Levyibacteriota bacterium]|nr:MAG: 30S ribosomal protein S17 [Candidatus Levybacteria bacterium]
MKTLKGIVLSTKMDKTAVIIVEQIKTHRLYKKRLVRHKKYKVEIESFLVKAGDVVKVVETKPLSKDKYFKVVEVLK